MLRLLLLLSIFQHARSVNIALYQLNVQAVGCNRLNVTFRVRNEIDFLSGVFFACGGTTCSRRSFDKYRDQNKTITIPINLSPCKSYDRIEITSRFDGNKDDKKDYTRWRATAFGDCCPELTSEAPTTTTTATTTTAPTTLEGEDPISPVSGSKTTSDSKNTISSSIIIVVGVVLIALIAIVLVTIFVRVKRKSEEKNKRGDVT